MYAAVMHDCGIKRAAGKKLKVNWKRYMAFQPKKDKEYYEQAQELDTDDEI